MSEATRLKPTVAEDVRTRRQTSQQTAEQADIKSNAYFKAVFDTSLTPDQKVEAIRKLVAATQDSTRADLRERIQQLEAFKEYLQSVRETMATEIVRLTDTDAMGVLKDAIDKMTTDLVDFDNQMKPVTDIIDAIYQLRMDGKTIDAFKEIREDREHDEELQRKRNELADRRRQLENNIKYAEDVIHAEANNKSMFGFGGLKTSAKLEIEKRSADIDSYREELAALDQTEKELVVQRESSLGALADAKTKLKELLDISAPEHKDRQTALVQAALNFIKTSKEQIGTARQHLAKMGAQYEKLSDNNEKITTVYALIEEGVKKGEADTRAVREQLIPKPDDDRIVAMEKERRTRELESHIKALESTNVDTVSTFGDLTTQTIRINSAIEANEAQSNAARKMYTQGVAGIADRLSITLQGVSAAAVHEASSMAKTTLNRMQAITNEVAQKEAIKSAMGIQEENADLIRAAEDLEQYGEVLRSTTETTRQGLTEMRNLVADLKRIADETQADIGDRIAINADLASDRVDNRVKAAIGDNDPFK